MNSQERTERFYRCIWPHAATVLRSAQILCHAASEADDLAQETMLKAFRHIEQYKDGSSAQAWLMQILRNTRIDHFRSGKARRATLSLDEHEIDVAAGPDLTTDANEWTDPRAMLQAFSDADIIGALKELPEDIRMTLLLVDVEQMEHQAAAEVLGVPVGTVKSRAHRGRAILKASLLPLAKQLRLVREE